MVDTIKEVQHSSLNYIGLDIEHAVFRPVKSNNISTTIWNIQPHLN